jgi:hypothetical protein
LSHRPRRLAITDDASDDLDAMTALVLRPTCASPRPCVAIGLLLQHPRAQRLTVQTELRNDDGLPALSVGLVDYSRCRQLEARPSRR